MMKPNKNKTMLEVTKGYEGFIKRQELKYGKEEFEHTLKKAATPKPKKQRGSK